jgi:tungstate transport system permease protein
MTESILSITVRSLYISALASFGAFIIAILISLHISRSKKYIDMLSPIFEALVGVPTTVIGLFVYVLLCPSGPLSFLKLLYTPYAIMFGEFLVALPIAVTYMIRHFYSTRESVRELVLSLGSSDEKIITMLVLRELAPVLISSYLVAFSRAIGELGVALIVGGGIEGYTNVLTTAIALQTSMGNYEYAIWIGLVLISITMIIVLVVKLLGEYVIWK